MTEDVRLLDDWVLRCRATTEEVSARLVSETEIRSYIPLLLQDPSCPFEAFHVSILRKTPFDEVQFGAGGVGEPAETRRIDDFDSFGTVCRIEVWHSPKARKAGANIDFAPAVAAILALVKAYWKPELRDSTSWLISRQNAERNNLIDATLLHYLRDHEGVALLYGDLDNFKSANDTLGEIEGDRIIREFGSLIERASGPDSIPVHRSGDTFVAIHPTLDARKMLHLGWNFTRIVGQHQFNSGSVKLGMKIGITFADAKAGSVTYKDLETPAQNATAGPGGVKFRGRTRLAGKNPDVLPPADSHHWDIALALIKSNLLGSWALSNPWLAVISDYICEESRIGALSVAGIADATRNILTWAGLEVDNTILTAAYGIPHRLVEAKASNMDVALAVAHGLFRRASASDNEIWADRWIELTHHEHLTFGCLTLRPDDITAFSWGEPTDDHPKTIQLGGFPHLSTDSASRQPSSTRQALLIKIGHNRLAFPTDAFDEVIVVDDRPTRGGGLPDFWEATIARVVGRVASNPSIRALFVLGEHADAKATLSKLRSIDAWPANADQMSYKTGMTNNAIVNASQRLKDAVQFPQDAQELFASLASVLQTRCILSSSSSASSSLGSQRFLNRQLQLDRLSLGREDGCRVATIAEACPVVLEVVRHSTAEGTIRDQASQRLRELVDFKVHLLQPQQEMVPSFYSEEKQSLEDYFAREFLSDEGLFCSRLKVHGQLDAVIGHVIAVICDPENQFSTRRAILVVPHEITGDRELAPLGLVSVRIVPRFVALRPVVHFSFSWRTVEAVVGFPYSLYGSVRFAQHATDLIRAGLNAELQRTLEMGTVSYIAHSLHFFLDDYGQNIARRIVDDASI